MRKWGVFIFLALLAANITGVESGLPWLVYVTKPLLMPVLALLLFTEISQGRKGLFGWMLAGLFFSWGGDMLLLFQDRDPLFFLLGLSSFLLAHVAYIFLFHHIRVRESVKANPWFLVIVVIYYAVLMSWLSPYLGDMKIPVRIYGIVISFMCMLAMHVYLIRNRKAALLIMLGAGLFILSDSILAINKFYEPVASAGLLIMLTYGLAQLGITLGIIRYLRGGGPGAQA